MKKSVKFLIIFTLFSFLNLSFVSVISEAASYTLSWNLVKGKDLHWRNNSKYTTEINKGINTWNAYSSGTIKTFTTANTDVTVSDYTENSSTAGVTSSNRTIKLNKKLMDTFTSAKKQNVATHEFGHALGLAHSTSGNVLYAYVSTVTSLGQSDKDSFNAAKKKWN